MAKGNNVNELSKVKSGKGKKIFKGIVILVGIQITANYISKLIKKFNEEESNTKSDNWITSKVIFGGREINLEGQEFKGATLKAVCSGIKLDLTDAIINDDVTIECKSVMSGINIVVPDDVTVEVDANSKYSGISNRVPVKDDEDRKTIFINAKCVMSGIDVQVQNDCIEEVIEEDKDKEVDSIAEVVEDAVEEVAEDTV